jgi:DNA-binding beta-propeller fold protein YncE
MRGGTNLLAVDGRTGSLTLNQVILNINLGSIQSMALDETHRRLYVSGITFNSGNVNTGRVSVVDIDPVSPSFHTVITDVPTPGNPGSIGVNPATNKVYVSVSASTSTASSGLYVLDGSTFSLTQMSDMVALGISAIAVNDLDNVVYAIGGSTLFAIDGASDARRWDLLLPGRA